RGARAAGGSLARHSQELSPPDPRRQIARQVAYDQRRFGLPGTAPAGQACGGRVTKKSREGLPPMSQAYIIDGKEIAAKVRADVAADVARMKAQHGFSPGLAVVLVGEDPASKVYVRNK